MSAYVDNFILSAFVVKLPLSALADNPRGCDRAGGGEVELPRSRTKSHRNGNGHAP
jgi:hypothetical protein